MVLLSKVCAFSSVLTWPKICEITFSALNLCKCYCFQAVLRHSVGMLTVKLPIKKKKLVFVSYFQHSGAKVSVEANNIHERALFLDLILVLC